MAACSLSFAARLRLKCDGTCAETKFHLTAKRTSPFKSAGASVQLTTGCRGVSISGSNAGYTMFRGSVKSTGYPLPSLPLPCVTVCHQVSTGLYRSPVQAFAAPPVVLSWFLSSSLVFQPLISLCLLARLSLCVQLTSLEYCLFVFCAIAPSGPWSPHSRGF